MVTINNGREPSATIPLPQKVLPTDLHKRFIDQTIIDILRSFKERRFCFNEETISLLEQLKVSKKTIGLISKISGDQEYSEAEVEAVIGKYLPEISELQKTRILEASAIASYHREVGYPVVEVLMCDDAPQFKLVPRNLALCWIHEGRHYKKLEPVIPENVKRVKEFIGRYWAYYKRLLKF